MWLEEMSLEQHITQVGYLSPLDTFTSLCYSVLSRKLSVLFPKLWQVLAIHISLFNADRVSHRLAQSHCYEACLKRLSAWMSLLEWPVSFFWIQHSLEFLNDPRSWYKLLITGDCIHPVKSWNFLIFSQTFIWVIFIYKMWKGVCFSTVMSMILF